MDSRIKEDIVHVLQEAVSALKTSDFMSLSKISDKTIHNISIYQDSDSLSTAVLIYSLSKIIQRCVDTSCPVPSISTTLMTAREGLLSDNFGKFNKAYEDAFDIIKKHDKHLKMYVEEVLSKAKTKKGQKLAQHGLSLSRISEMMGITQWELQSYVGKTVTEEVEERKMSAKKRLDLARSMFS